MSAADPLSQDYSIVPLGKFRCVCGRVVRFGNTYVVKYTTSARIDSQNADIVASKRVCIVCKLSFEKLSRQK